MIGLYARQSIDKKDSISIEFQIETCKRKLSPDEDLQVKIYSDKGFSGKSTNRPEFQNMIQDMKDGQISKIIVYKVDRISRSLLDFLKMQEEFNKYNVKFVSCLEDFDTSSSTGKMMMNMLMMFAEMEREAIQKRITDNYYARGEKGLYLGGCAPFGYTKVETQHLGKKTYMFIINEPEAKIVKEMYELYAYHNKSLNELARILNERKIETKRKAPWGANIINRMLHNPMYVKANADIYTYLKSKGATLNNPVEDYIGVNGCYVYGKVSERRSLKFTNYESDYITLGLHEGFIEPSLWLQVQYRMNSRKTSSNLGTGKLSWAQGLVRCKTCNYSCYVKRCKNTDKGKEFRYFYCRGKRHGTCTASTKMLKVDFLENNLERALIKRLRDIQDLEHNEEPKENPEVNRLKIELEHISEKIENLISSISDASEISMKYINNEIEKLDRKKTEIDNRICELQVNGFKHATAFDVKDVIDNWGDYDITQKSLVAKSLIKKVEVDGQDITIDFYS